MKKIWDIHGGIHPPQSKNQSLGQSITPCPIPNILVFPLSQHIGAAAKPVVEVGDLVKKGQRIAAADGKFSAAIHASTSGKVIAIEDRPIAHPSGISDSCIVIEADGNDQWRKRSPKPDWLTEEKTRLIDRITHAGIAGMGGAGFPTTIKLCPPPSATVDTLIINGTECEPYITADHALMRERASVISEGIAILATILAPKRIIVGIEDNKPDIIEGMTAELENAISKVRNSNEALANCLAEIVTFPTKYPSGGEKQLIQILTGKQVPTGKLPIDLGIVCQNIGTAAAICNAIVNDEPLISRVTTATGNNIGKPGNYEVRLGTPVSFLLEHVNYTSDEHNTDIASDKAITQRIVMGGPMMGYALNDTDAPIIKTSNCILAPSHAEMPEQEPAQPCIRCGYCASACPVSLLPQQLYWFAQGKELDKLEQHNLADCIECGACAYVCPSNIPLVQYYRASKAELRQRKQDLQNAEHSKLRFEARQQRLERLEQEKIAARIARQKKAEANKRNKNDDPKAATIAAALERVGAKKQSSTMPVSTNKSPSTDDPIAKALAARRAQQGGENTADSIEMFEKALVTAQSRLSKAQEKLEQSIAENDKNVEAFRAGVKKCATKVSAANDAIDAFKLKSSPVDTPETPHPHE